ncbi:MAG TPA: TetR/AcrR family transcriptional regulator, partial [Polyangia bacterium]
MSRLTRAVAPRQSYHHGDLKNALIAAGVEILSKEGVAGLSLRKVALRAGVSHAAPYAHFADKPALIAAISTEGFERLYQVIADAVAKHTVDPAAQLLAGAWAYVNFALTDPDHFKVTLSGVVEKEEEHPAFVAVSKKSFALVVDIVRACQGAGVLRAGPAELLAVTVWSLMHGLVSLLLEKQIPRSVRGQHSTRALLIAMLNQIALV